MWKLFPTFNIESRFPLWLLDPWFQHSIFDAYWIKIPTFKNFSNIPTQPVNSTINIECILNQDSHFDFGSVISFDSQINNQYSMHIESRFPLWLLDPWFHSILKSTINIRCILNQDSWFDNQYSMHIESQFPLWLLDPWNQQSIFDAYWIKIPTLTFGSVISFGSQNQQSIFDAYWIKIPDSTINIECILDQDSHFDFWIRDFDNQYWMHIGSRFPLWLLDPWFHSILKSTINIRCILNLNSWFDNQYWMHIGSRFVMWN